jgi:hypothetical protein
VGICPREVSIGIGGAAFAAPFDQAAIYKEDAILVHSLLVGSISEYGLCQFGFRTARPILDQENENIANSEHPALLACR